MTEKKIENSSNKVSKQRKIFAVCKMLLLVAVIVGIPLLLYYRFGDIIRSFETMEDVDAFLLKYEDEAAVVYFIIQAMQIVISVLPGEVFHMAAGYAFGIGQALFLAYFGAVTGSVIAFWIARVLGQDFLHIVFGEEKIEKYIKTFNSKKAYLITFIIFLMPGIPKDMLCYVAGASEMKFLKFIILSSLGRLPALSSCVIMGAMIEQEKINTTIIIGAVAAFILILCIIFRKKIMAWLSD